MPEVAYIPDPREMVHHPSRQFDCCGAGAGAGACVPPTAPSDVAATAIGSLQLDVTWTDNSSDETGFDIRWRNVTTAGAFVDAPSVGPNVTTTTIDASGGSSDGDSIEVQVRAAGTDDCDSDWVSAPNVVITDTN